MPVKPHHPLIRIKSQRYSVDVPALHWRAQKTIGSLLRPLIGGKSRLQVDGSAHHRRPVFYWLV